MPLPIILPRCDCTALHLITGFPSPQSGGPLVGPRARRKLLCPSSEPNIGGHRFLGGVHASLEALRLHRREGEGRRVNTQRTSGTRTPSMWTGLDAPKPDDYCPERLSKRCVDLGFCTVLA